MGNSSPSANFTYLDWYIVASKLFLLLLMTNELATGMLPMMFVFRKYRVALFLVSSS